MAHRFDLPFAGKVLLDAESFRLCMEARRYGAANAPSAVIRVGTRFARGTLMRRPRKKGNTGTTSEPSSDSSVATMPEQGQSAPEPHESAPQSFGDTSASADRDRIAMRAYELYLARGASQGRELDDWLAAERELSSSPTNRNED